MRFIKSAATTVAFKLVTIACGLGASVIVGRTLGPDGRGVFGLITTILTLTAVFGSFGLHTANVYMVAKDKSLARTIGGHSLLVGSIGAISSWFLLWLLAEIYPSSLRGLEGSLMIVTLFMIPFFLWGYLFSEAFLGANRIVAFNFFEVAQRVVFFLVAVFALWLWPLGMNTYLLATAVLLLVFVFGYLLYYFKNTTVAPLFDRKLLNDTFAYGIRSYVATVFTWATLRSGIFFVNQYQGTHEAGMFAAAQQISELLMVIPSVIGTVLFPRVASDNDPQLTVKVMHTMMLLYLPCCLIVGLLAYPIIWLLYGAEFLACVPALLILLVGAAFIGFEVVLAGDIRGRGYPWAAALIWIPALAGNIIGYIVLLPKFGIIGAAFSVSATYLIVFVYIVFYFRKMTGVGVARLFLPDRTSLRVIISSIKQLTGK